MYILVASVIFTVFRNHHHYYLFPKLFHHNTLLYFSFFLSVIFLNAPDPLRVGHPAEVQLLLICRSSSHVNYIHAASRPWAPGTSGRGSRVSAGLISVGLPTKPKGSPWVPSPLASGMHLRGRRECGLQPEGPRLA